MYQNNSTGGEQNLNCSLNLDDNENKRVDFKFSTETDLGLLINNNYKM